MPLELALKRMMDETIVRTPFSGKDAWNNPSFGTAVSYTARVQQKVVVLRNADGREVTSATQCYVATTDVFDERDLITLPSGYLPQQPPIIHVKPVHDEQGGHHTVVFL